MDFLDRRWFIPGLVLIVCLVLLGRWAMRADDAVTAPPRPETLASIDGPPVRVQLPASAESASAIAPSTDKSVSAFGILRGRVIDAVTREPVREFELEFHGRQATKVGDEAPGKRSFRAVDGRFAWEYLPPGNWTVTASARGYQRFELFGLHIPKGDATPEIVLPLRAGHRLSGRIYDEASGDGIASASIGFRESDTGRFEGGFRMRIRVTSGKDGSFVLEGVPPGRITLEISAQNYAGRELDVAVGDETSPLEIGLSTGGAIAGRLTAADGVTPVAGTVGLFNLDQGFGGSRRTGEAGEFSYQHLSAGRYQLTGQTPDGSVTREVVLASNQRMEGVVLALSVGRSIRGVITGLRPEDLKRVGITIYGDAGGSSEDVGVDDHGAFALHGVKPGRVHVVANVTMRRQLSKTIEMPADADITVNFDFPRGARLSGRVTRGGTPLSSVWLTPRPTVEQPVFIYGTSTSKEGKYVIEDLATGEYAVWVGNFDYKSRPVQISGDTVFDIDVPPAQLSGRVLEEGGKAPVVGAEVDVWPAEPSSSGPRLHDRSDHFGQFEIAGLEPGDIMLTTYKPGYEMFRKRISYSSPVAGMTVSLRQETGVEIRVHEAGSGKPLQRILASEMIGDHHGSRLQLHLDDDGLGYIPVALTGTTLLFSASGYVPTVIDGWNGQKLDLQLKRQKAQRLPPGSG